MKVKSTRPALRRSSEELADVRRKCPPARPESFERHFHTLGREQYEEYIDELTRKIEAQGEQLARRVDMAELERFRSLVAELINELVSNAYSFRREKAIDVRGRQKVFATVDKINEKLEALAREILEGKRDKLEIMNRIDEIRGLIIDILL